MNFPPLVKSWIILVCTALGAGVTLGTTSFLGGCSPLIATLVGLGAAANAIVHALQSSPKDKAAASNTTPPILRP